MVQISLIVRTKKRDEAEANFKASRDAATATKAQYDMARLGARAEDKLIATSSCNTLHD